jgi:hypothetical protein
MIKVSNTIVKFLRVYYSNSPLSKEIINGDFILEMWSCDKVAIT